MFLQVKPKKHGQVHLQKFGKHNKRNKHLKNLPTPTQHTTRYLQAAPSLYTILLRKFCEHSLLYYVL